MDPVLSVNEISALSYGDLKELCSSKEITTPDKKKQTLIDALVVFYHPDLPPAQDNQESDNDTSRIMREHIIKPLTIPWSKLMDILRKTDFQFYQNMVSRGESENRRLLIASFFESKLK